MTMRKFALLLIVSIAVGSSFMISCDDAPVQPVIHPERQEWYTHDVRQKVESYRYFRESMDSTLTMLEQNEISLADAAQSVHDAAQKWWPLYLFGTTTAETGRTPLEQIARNLIAHLRIRAEVSPELEYRVRALETELERSSNPNTLQ